jgi:formylglycine-generating enzyme
MKRLVCFVFVVAFAALAAELAHGLVPDRKPIGETNPPKYFTNSLGMKFAWIPPGTFMMGSPISEAERSANETQHKVTLTKGFYMGVYTLTRAQWKEFMGQDHSNVEGDNNSPVDNEGWDDCQEFIKKLQEKDGKPYRLPTEAEWEYACRAGTTTPFHFGETISTDQVNFDGQFAYRNGAKGVSRGKPTPGGTFPANAWGLHDMHGNVWQWCQDCYREYSPTDITDPQGPDKRGLRVLRGGYFNTSAGICRSAFRFWVGDGRRGNNFLRRNSGGFRVCFSLE